MGLEDAAYSVAVADAVSLVEASGVEMHRPHFGGRVDAVVRKMRQNGLSMLEERVALKSRDWRTCKTHLGLLSRLRVGIFFALNFGNLYVAEVGVPK